MKQGITPFMKIKTFTNDSYIIDIPKKSQQTSFFKYFPFYQNLTDYNHNHITIAPIAIIYGTNEYGQKCATHIHGFFPFFYIKTQQFTQAFHSQQYKVKFLDNLSNIYKKQFKSSYNSPVILRATMQQKYDFYGYHTQKQWFLKIQIFDKTTMRQLWEILSSKVINNKSFQCYQGHISYFMQLFSQLNLYGVTQMKIKKFSFRRHAQLADLFQKINPNLNAVQTQISIMNQGWNLNKISETNPQMFNQTQKNSSCYLQIDVFMENIENAYDMTQNDSDKQSLDSSQEQFVNQQMQKNIKVKLTKALTLIWEDQKSRRKYSEIKQPVDGIIDLSKNIENSVQAKNGKIDILIANFYNKNDEKGSIKDQVFNLFKNSLTVQKFNQKKQFFVNQGFAQNFRNTLSLRNQQLVGKVLDRWKAYGVRKQHMYNQLMAGKKSQVPQWDQNLMQNLQKIQNQQENDNNSQQQNEINDNQSQFNFDSRSEISETKSAFSVLMSNNKKPEGNTRLYRKNFKVIKGHLKKDSYFFICQLCRKKKGVCRCPKLVQPIYEKMDEQSNSYVDGDMKMQIQQQQQKQQDNGYHVNKFKNSFRFFSKIQNQKKLSNQITLKYKIKPPNKLAIHQDIIVEHQQPFYSEISDLFQQYQIPSVFGKSLNNAQILDRELRPNKKYQNHPIVSIKNQLKLPYFWKYHQSHCSQTFNSNSMSTINLKYTFANPPSRKQVQQEILLQQFPCNPIKTKTREDSSMPNQQLTFVSDLVLLKYELIVRPSVHYGNPDKDPLQAIIFQLSNFKNQKIQITGLIILEKHFNQQIDLYNFDDVFTVKNQKSILYLFSNIVFRSDPDLLITYDQQKKGIFYLVQRGFQYGIDLTKLMARNILNVDNIFEMANFCDFKMEKQTQLTRKVLFYGNVAKNSIENSKRDIKYIQFLKTKIKQGKQRKPLLRKKYKYDIIATQGRVNLNLYRICQQQIKLKCYTLEAVVKHLFNWQLYQFTDAKVYELLKMNTNYAIQYVKRRVQFYKDIMHQLNTVGRIIEKSKLYGADFVSMMQRGSQFKIQSVMCRVTKQNNYLNLSASKYQVANQSILQCVPFVMQPQKRFFSQPVLVFDFQSLYPSVMIAYNLCYSTCLGSIKQSVQNGRLKKLGVSSGISIDYEWIQKIINYHSQEQAKKMLQNYLFITPNKVMFVKKNIRDGIIPRILLQFLVSRIMIKKSLKFYKKQLLINILKERQQAIKLFMNVMYGYTGASFTGRMPCSQIADSVVQVSKYCLGQAIKYLNNHSKFKGKVVYGDTDSIFFHIPSIHISQACQVGRKLAVQMTALFPYPMQMKFQKAYDSLVLVSKKRYYGKSYQTEQSKPKYEGKGLECVRRDGISLTSSLMQKMLNTLIDTKDLSIVKNLFKKQYSQLIYGFKLPNQLSLAKQIKSIKYSQKYMPAHGQAAKRLTQIDQMLQPKYGQRMKYIIVKSQQKSQRDRAIPLFQYQTKNQSLFYNYIYEPDYKYYADRQVVPPLFRTFRCVDINSWIKNYQYKYNPLNSSIFVRKHCLNCNKISKTIICFECIKLGEIQSKIQQINSKAYSAYDICKSCTGGDCSNTDIQSCIQWNCQQLYRRQKAVEYKKKIIPQLNKLKNVSKQLKLY